MSVCEQKRGMTRERWAEIKAKVAAGTSAVGGTSSYVMLCELVSWINQGDPKWLGGLVPLRFDEPPKPVVIDGPGEYECESGWKAKFSHVSADDPPLVYLDVATPNGEVRYRYQPDGRLGDARVQGFEWAEGLRIVRKHVPPVVIDGPGRYWFKGDNGIEECDVNAGGGQWRATGYRHCWTGQSFDEHGDMIGIPRGEPWRILGRVQYRTRPLTPDEAFKLLGKQVRHVRSGYCCDIYSVGEKGVHLRRWNEYPIDPSNWGFPYEVTFEELASQYRNDYGVDPFVREPVPFSEATT